MRKIVAVILLLTFVAAQYARQVSYLECKLVNYFSPSAAKCDCEKLLVATSNSSPTPQPILHNHIHLDEWYSLANHYLLIQPVAKPRQSWPIIPGPTPITGINKIPDHPPQC